ncbi:MAG: CHAT domain-containing protein, partial [Planctomycetota bacterium]
AGFDDWQLLGSPVDGADLEGPAIAVLPGAERELSDLSALWPKAVVAKGTKFQRASFEQALLSGNCVHVATHLEAAPDEARSRFPATGLRLNDGIVASAREIADLTPSAPLVVLSACETGGGRYSDGEGLFGVARAFLEGGTRNLVVTLWPVEDEAAHDFAVSFHRALKSGALPSQATRLARSELRASKPSARDWAAFRFIGRD